jgi:hypothetical protein
LEDFANDRRRDLAEITVSYALLLATIWSARPLRVYLGAFALASVVIFLLAGARRSGSFGLGLHGLRESLWAVGLALAGVAISVICAAAIGTLHYHRIIQSSRMPLVGYLGWSLIQQLILQNLFLSRLLRLLHRPSLAIFAAAIMMSAAHLPNPILAVGTLFWGLAACWLFLHYRNLYVVAFIHFLFGLCLAICVPSSLNHNMRVGRGYAHYLEVHRSTPDAGHPGLTLSPRHARRLLE